MEPRHRIALRQNRVRLVQELVISEKFLNTFRPEGILQPERIEDLLHTSLRANRVRQFLDLLPRRGPKAMSVFVKALVDTGQEALAVVLEPVLTVHRRVQNNIAREMRNLRWLEIAALAEARAAAVIDEDQTLDIHRRLNLLLLQRMGILRREHRQTNTDDADES